MATWVEHVGARVAYWHAQRVAAGFQRALQDLAQVERVALARALRVVTASTFGRDHALNRVRSVADLRSAVPLRTYEDYRPVIDRVANGETTALFAPGTRLAMFATSSGTTAARKRIPVTLPFIADYRRGWNVFGLKMLGDHPRAILRAILQASGRHDAEHTSSGLPCGAITGLLAKSQKRIVRRFYVGRPEIAHLADATARYYTLMRLGAARDVAFAITANPATLIQMARTADEHSETLIRDVRDGTLSPAIVTPQPARDALAAGLRPESTRAAELERCRRLAGCLRPRDYWKLEFLACWTGGSLGHYLGRLREWWGPVPVRDIGLLASEGRVTLPLEDDTPIGVLDITAGVFEFIPIEAWDTASPATLGARALEVGREYAVVLTNTSGLIRYRLDDVVRVHGFVGQAPRLEFRYRAGRVASVAGEKLTECQVVAAMRRAWVTIGFPECDFLLSPAWGDPPFYRLTIPAPVPRGVELASALDEGLRLENEEYESRRNSRRLGPVVAQPVPLDALAGIDRLLRSEQESVTEQFKRPVLLIEPDRDASLLSRIRTDGDPSFGGLAGASHAV